MTLVSLRAIAKMYGGRPLLSSLDWTIEERARVGLVGPNGAGKSTLLRIIAGIEPFQTGEAVRRRGLRCAYLPQHIEGDQRTPLQVVLGSRAELADVEAALAACEAELASPAAINDLRRMERILARQEQLLSRFEELGGPGAEGEARSYLRAFGFDDAEMEQPMEVLSGGQRKLVVLAACLAQRPALLLLDEPEAHLDLLRREQLQELIHSFKGAVVIVSHDRYLLDETVTEIVELDQGKLSCWPGNYSAYALARELALQRQQQLYSAQQKEIARLEEAIRRFKLWARIVANERHIRQARVKQRQIDQIEKVERPVLERRKMALQLRSAARGGQKVLELRQASVELDDHLILLGIDLTLSRGERVGIIGPNGAGKTVLSRLLTGQLRPTEGQHWIGPSIRIGYFSQAHEMVSFDATPLELVRTATPMYEEQAVALLARYLFSYNQVHQPVATLSGGERTRLQLLLLMLGGANCLVLDEPTNHLDIDSIEVLEAALEQYDGTVILISHDRYFLDRIADRIVELRDGEAFCFDGGYSDWVAAVGGTFRRLLPSTHTEASR